MNFDPDVVSVALLLADWMEEVYGDTPDDDEEREETGTYTHIQSSPDNPYEPKERHD